MRQTGFGRRTRTSGKDRGANNEGKSVKPSVDVLFSHGNVPGSWAIRPGGPLALRPAVAGSLPLSGTFFNLR